MLSRMIKHVKKPHIKIPNVPPYCKILERTLSHTLEQCGHMTETGQSQTIPGETMEQSSSVDLGAVQTEVNDKSDVYTVHF